MKHRDKTIFKYRDSDVEAKQIVDQIIFKYRDSEAEVKGGKQAGLDPLNQLARGQALVCVRAVVASTCVQEADDDRGLRRM